MSQLFRIVNTCRFDSYNPNETFVKGLPFMTADAAHAIALAINAKLSQSTESSRYWKTVPVGYVLSKAKDLIKKPAPVAQQQALAVFELVTPYITRRTAVPVKAVEHNDNGSITVVIDHWPAEAGKLFTPNPL